MGDSDASGWEHWTYLKWNELLLRHYFRVDDGAMKGVPVERIPAGPEDLWELAGRPVVDPVRVVDAFLARVRQEMPARRTTFCSYCFDWDGWTPDAPSIPHFFAMLWLTCHVASGYPVVDANYFGRVRQVLGRSDNFRFAIGTAADQRGCLPELWEAFANWTLKRQQSKADIRPLKLPESLGPMKVIGYSHYLAFPNRLDRSHVAAALAEAGLLGFEPPIAPAIRALLHRRNRLSKEFCDELDEFVEALRVGEDPRRNAFWRAIRQEALEPYTPERGVRVEAPRTALVFRSGDDGLWPIVVCRDDAKLPEGFETAVFDPGGQWPSYIVGANRDEEAAWRAAFDGDPVVPLGTQKLVEQGLLVLRESSSGTFDVVSGRLVSGCSSALVREDLVEPFVHAFGGRPSRSVVDHWFEVGECQIRQLDKAAPGLERVSQLLFTMEPPSVAFVGGVMTSGGYFCPPQAARSFLPKVRALGAVSVRVRPSLAPDLRVPDDASGDTSTTEVEFSSCTRATPDDVDWALPDVVREPGTYELAVVWPSASGVATAPTRSDLMRLRIVEYHLEDEFKPKPAGAFYLESCPRAEEVIEQVSEVPLGITTHASPEAADLLEWDASARYLGPGVGEMCLTRRPGFDWLVLGAKNSPEMIVFVGDSAAPSLPADRRSPNANDRRLWHKAWNAKRRLARAAGTYLPLEDAPDAVRNAYRQYRHHKVADTAPDCELTGLETAASVTLPKVTPRDATQAAADLLAARSSRRSGLRFAEASDILACVLAVSNGWRARLLLHQVIRSWAEAGILDVLRDPRTSTRTLVARRPRFVLVRRGQEVEATVVGLLNSHRRTVLERAAREIGVELVSVSACNPWQPSTARVRSTAEAVEELRRCAGLPASEWLAWSDAGPVPWFDVGRAVASLDIGPPPNAYQVDATWDWGNRAFTRENVPDDTGVRLERRRHRDGSSIYVVVAGGQAVLWCHLRAWAVLAAHAARQDPPFRETSAFLLASDGRSPVHLPLPLARLCVLIGDGLPGPECSDREQLTDSPSLRYVYPFGPRLFRWVRRLLPNEWIATGD